MTNTLNDTIEGGLSSEISETSFDDMLVALAKFWETAQKTRGVTAVHYVSHPDSSHIGEDSSMRHLLEYIKAVPEQAPSYLEIEPHPLPLRPDGEVKHERVLMYGETLTGLPFRMISTIMFHTDGSASETINLKVGLLEDDEEKLKKRQVYLEKVNELIFDQVAQA